MLKGWKAIAKHMGVSQRTAIKYADERGLPIRQLEGDGGTVLAFSEDIAKWWMTATVPRSPRGGGAPAAP